MNRFWKIKTMLKKRLRMQLHLYSPPGGIEPLRRKSTTDLKSAPGPPKFSGAFSVLEFPNYIHVVLNKHLGILRVRVEQIPVDLRAI